jgi:capsule biosynthesis phosphatase
MAAAIELVPTRDAKVKRLIMDLDDTICRTKDGNYTESEPVAGVVEKLHEYKRAGFDIVIHTSRNVRTFEGNVGKITAHTLPIIIEWLRRHNIPYDEIYVGKPWCGHEGFYVDDRAIRPSEFCSLSLEEITALLKQGK